MKNIMPYEWTDGVQLAGNWGLSPVLRRKIIAMEEKYDEQFRVVFEAIRQLLIEEEKPKKRIGF